MNKIYGTATFEEINEGMRIATDIGCTIRSIPNPAVRQMVKELVALVYISPKRSTQENHAG